MNILAEYGINCEITLISARKMEQLAQMRAICLSVANIAFGNMISLLDKCFDQHDLRHS